MSNKSSDSNKATVNTDIGFTRFLTIDFIVLKLIGVIEWGRLLVLIKRISHSHHARRK